jgi:hypothetical protein
MLKPVAVSKFNTRYCTSRFEERGEAVYIKFEPIVDETHRNYW